MTSPLHLCANSVCLAYLKEQGWRPSRRILDKNAKTLVPKEDKFVKVGLPCDLFSCESRHFVLPYRSVGCASAVARLTLSTRSAEYVVVVCISLLIPPPGTHTSEHRKLPSALWRLLVLQQLRFVD
jgi:hypothetical protein